MKTPPFLQPDDEIRIISPSGVIQPELIDGAKAFFESQGFRVTLGEYCKETYGRFAGTKEQRISDMQIAFDDDNVKAILCSRGGYGVSQIIDSIDFSHFFEHPKWVIGFSDITILHAAIQQQGYTSIHSIMAKHITELMPESPQVKKLVDILQGVFPAYKIEHHPLNRTGTTNGVLVGGNLSVIMAMRGTKFDSDYRNKILFIEDIGEKPYHIDRMLQNLRIGGVFNEIKGLIIGQFSDCEEDHLMNQTVAEIIANAVAEYDFPVCFNFPAGHVDDNMPLVLGDDIELEVSRNKSRVRFSNQNL